MPKPPVPTTADPVDLERKLIAREESEATGIPETTWPETRWTFVRKIGVAVSLALIVGYLLLWAQNVQETGGPDGYIRGNADRGPVDFISTLTGALVIKDGNGSKLYDVDLQTNAQNRIFANFRPALDKDHILPYNHLPFEALLITPFMNLPYPIVFALWTLICGIAIGMSLGLLDGALPVARPVGWVLSMAACAYMPLIRGLMQGQNSPLILLGLCGVYVTLKRGQPGWAGAALVLLALKPQVLPIILLLLVLQKQWKTLAVFAGILAGLSVLAMPFLGFDWPIKYGQLLIGVAGWGNTGAIDPSIMHNWRGFLTNIFGANSGLVTPLFALLCVVTALVVAYVWWRTSTGKEERSNRNSAYEPMPADNDYNPNFDLVWALAGIAAVLTSLHLNPHDLTLLVFPAWIIGAYATSGLWNRRVSLVWVILLSLGWSFAPLTLTNPQGIVIPSVLLMAVACGLLTWQLTGRDSVARSRQAVPI